jgi:hypothetical protein
MKRQYMCVCVQKASVDRELQGSRGIEVGVCCARAQVIVVAAT